jgi:putative SOS response-associated peptidase YedK
MCSNFEPIKTPQSGWVSEHFDCQLPEKDWKPHVSINYYAPFIFLEDGKPKCELARFGLIPEWAKDKTRHGRFTYNARCETVATKDSFRSSWKNQNFGIALADKFYEPLYDQYGQKSVPAGIYRTDAQPTAIACLWDRVTDETTGEEIFSFSMITQNADEHPFMRQFHKPTDEKRSVVVLENEDFEKWLTATHKQARELIKLSPDDYLKTDAVAPHVVDLFS